MPGAVRVGLSAGPARASSACAGDPSGKLAARSSHSATATAAVPFAGPCRRRATGRMPAAAEEHTVAPPKPWFRREAAARPHVAIVLASKSGMMQVLNALTGYLLADKPRSLPPQPYRRAVAVAGTVPLRRCRGLRQQQPRRGSMLAGRAHSAVRRCGAVGAIHPSARPVSVCGGCVIRSSIAVQPSTVKIMFPLDCVKGGTGKMMPIAPPGASAAVRGKIVCAAVACLMLTFIVCSADRKSVV